MKTARFAIIAGALLLAASAFAGDDGKVYGEGVTLEGSTPIAELLASPDDYVGTKVRVEGVITGLCKKRGCWMQVTDPDSGEGVRIKVEDGVIVFPYSAMGKQAVAEGVFDAVIVHTEEKGEAEAAHTECQHGGEGGEKVYLIQGTGAVISG